MYGWHLLLHPYEFTMYAFEIKIKVGEWYQLQDFEIFLYIYSAIISSSGSWEPILSRQNGFSFKSAAIAQ